MENSILLLTLPILSRPKYNKRNRKDNLVSKNDNNDGYLVPGTQRRGESSSSTSSPQYDTVNDDEIYRSSSEEWIPTENMRNKTNDQKMYKTEATIRLANI